LTGAVAPPPPSSAPAVACFAGVFRTGSGFWVPSGVRVFAAPVVDFAAEDGAFVAPEAAEAAVFAGVEAAEGVAFFVAEPAAGAAGFFTGVFAGVAFFAAPVAPPAVF